jgi:hypothetical protein
MLEEVYLPLDPVGNILRKTHPPASERAQRLSKIEAGFVRDASEFGSDSRSVEFFNPNIMWPISEKFIRAGTDEKLNHQSIAHGFVVDPHEIVKSRLRHSFQDIVDRWGPRWSFELIRAALAESAHSQVGAMPLSTTWTFASRRRFVPLSG